MFCFVLSMGMLTSCDKDDDDAKTDKIELISFGPTGAKHGDTLRFFGNNLNQVTAVQFTGGTGSTVEQKDFKSQTSVEILLIVPQAAERGWGARFCCACVDACSADQRTFSMARLCGRNQWADREVR